ncbi:MULTISPECIES: N-acyl-D-amino-acid deacylase family protein [Rhodococcus]|uniref:Amidohydrolase family protein n=1 Tax=Rhodococcus pseudokoreensis TaxID=2811421 RepID=A0A974VYX6_9NOCA|nr:MULTISPECIES: amidohydrolase family protein [Rhodococcus]MBV6757386.1 amidohydrolase family protein [Rhodococcus opacus]QSE88170.1 amidohydrolase family protein [Rhodococcus pseudokoreensis]
MSTAEYDLVIRGGEVHDGTGAEGRVADIAVKDGVIAVVGEVAGRGAEEIDATGRIVTPGFVDIHTHYDGQAVWDDATAPSSHHGVTTVVMGNCGVGFAPCKPEHRDGLIELMEGVEDIPAPVMHQGLTWTWETFAEYLDVLERTPRDIDICALVPHAPVRVHVMGERAFRLLPALPEDVEQMRVIVADAIRAGAWGVSTSRSTAHKSVAGDYTPTLLAREREIVGLAMGMADAGRGLFEFVAEVQDPDVIGEFEMVRRALKKSGLPGVYSLVQSGQTADANQDLWRDLLKYSGSAKDDGVDLRPVVAPRAVGLLMGLEGSQNPFSATPSYRAIADLPLAERVARMRDPEVRRQILSEDPYAESAWPLLEFLSYSRMYRFENPPNYTPDVANSLQAIADREGRPVQEVVYDVLLEDEGMGFIHVPFANYASGDLRVCQEMLEDPNSIMGLGDGGAHVGFILDAGFQTWMLTYWVKERGVMALPEAIRRMTSDTADVMGLADRGRIREGLRADLNVIDLGRLTFGSPYIAHDLPTGGKRLMQKAVGYEHTIVAGQTVYRDGEDTGARPGRLVRSGR